MNRTDRLYALVEQLRAVAPRPVSARRLAERFEVSSRTIERDISALQQGGVPIWAEPGRTGGYALDAAMSLPPLNFSATEVAAIAVALLTAPDHPLPEAGHAALQKIVSATSEAGRAQAADLVGRVHLFRRREERVPGPVRRAVEDAVARGRVVEICYVDRDGRESARCVEPSGLLRGTDAWYLVGWCRLRDAGRAFRFDRIAAARVLDEPALARPIKDVAPDVPPGYAGPLRLEA